jgi:hypothetical protein
MAEVHEAPIIHGIVSVSACTVSSEMQFSDGSIITGIENTLNTTSTNPITNSAVNNAINNIIVPPTSNFFVELLMNPSSTHASGTVGFSTRSVYINSYSGGGTNTSLDSVFVPVAGTYAISSSSKASTTGNEVNVEIRSNGSALISSTSEDLVMLTGTYFLTAGDTITLFSNNEVPVSSTMMVSLLKAEQTVPLQQGAMLPRNNCMTAVEKYTCTSEAARTQLVSDLVSDASAQGTSTISYMVTSPSTTVVERHAVILGTSAINTFIFADVTRSGVSSYGFHYIVPQNFTISNSTSGGEVNSTISDVASAQTASGQLASHHSSAGRPSTVSVHLQDLFVHRTV